MGFLNSIFGQKNKEFFTNYHTDIHSHLLPNLDDGSTGLDYSIDLIQEFIKVGFKKCITTPHVMGDFFKNTNEGINEKLQLVQNELIKRNIDFKITAGAEYYLDESFLDKINNIEPLMTFGNNYILFETSFLNQSSFLGECIFKLKARGLKPILAHPERYSYFYNDFKKYEEIYERGVLFQLNINSVCGYYSPGAQKIAEKLIDHKMVDFIGTDCHSMKHTEVMKKAFSTKYYHKLKDLDIKNELL